ncbi:MAG: glycosyltransferase [Bacteroidota bacterium]
MRILIISTFFPPQNSIASHRPYSWAKYWSQAGHEVCVVTTPKTKHAVQAMHMSTQGFEVIELGYGKLLDMLVKKYKGKQSDISQSTPQKKGLLKRMAGWLFKRLDHYRISKGIFHFRRFPDFSSYWSTQVVRFAMSRHKWDVVVSTYGPYTTHAAAYELRKNGTAGFWVADFRDLWTDDHIFRGLAVTRWYEHLLEKRYLATSDLVVTVSDPLAAVLAKKCGKDVLTIENGYDPSDLQSLPTANIFADRPEKVRIVYTGSLYPGKYPDLLFQAISNLAANGHASDWLDRLEVVFVGGNIHVMEPLVEKYGVGRWVRSEGFISREDALRMQRDAHVLLFLENNDGGVEGILTGKLFEYLSSGTSIWAVGVDEKSSPGQVIMEAHAGMCFGKDVEALQHQLQLLLQNQVKPPISVPRELLIRFQRQTLAGKLMDHIMEPRSNN